MNSLHRTYRTYRTHSHTYAVIDGKNTALRLDHELTSVQMSHSPVAGPPRLECTAHAQRSCGSVRIMGGASSRSRPRHRSGSAAARSASPHRGHPPGDHAHAPLSRNVYLASASCSRFRTANALGPSNLRIGGSAPLAAPALGPSCLAAPTLGPAACLAAKDLGPSCRTAAEVLASFFFCSLSFFSSILNVMATRAAHPGIWLATSRRHSGGPCSSSCSSSSAASSISARFFSR
eukprot:scaffold36645_cov67-Phaeocystis_antarctica.AAC.3